MTNIDCKAEAEKAGYCLWEDVRGFWFKYTHDIFGPSLIGVYESEADAWRAAWLHSKNRPNKAPA